MEEKEFYSIADIAEKLSLSQKSIRRYIASGQLGAVKIGSTYRIPKGALEYFINNQTNTARVVNYDLFGNIVDEHTVIRHSVKSDNVHWFDIRNCWKSTGRSSMTFVDCFCGAGGLSKGLELSGLEGVCGLDWFKEAGMTYERNFNHPFVNGDITLPEVKQHFYDVVEKQLNGRHLNIVAGGFPCQGFSMAGNRIVDDPRNSLYKELLEIVEHLQPDFVICENVKGLRSMLGGMVEQKILADFKAIGYNMNVTTLCAADYEVPQKRERVIFIGNRIGKINYHPKPMLDSEHYKTTGEAIADLMNHPEDKAFNHVPTKHKPEMEERMKACPEGQSLYKGYSDAWKKCPWNEASCTIKENHGGVNIHPKLPRVLTAREMARLQSFPDDFIFEGPKNKQLVQIGNAVPPLLGKAIGLAIRKSAGELETETVDVDFKPSCTTESSLRTYV